MEIAGDVAEATINSVKAQLETVKAGAYAALSDFISDIPIENMVFSKSGGGGSPWVLEGICKVAYS